MPCPFYQLDYLTHSPSSLLVHISQEYLQSLPVMNGPRGYPLQMSKSQKICFVWYSTDLPHNIFNSHQMFFQLIL